MWNKDNLINDGGLEYSKCWFDPSKLTISVKLVKLSDPISLFAWRGLQVTELLKKLN